MVWIRSERGVSCAKPCQLSIDECEGGGKGTEVAVASSGKGTMDAELLRQSIRRLHPWVDLTTIACSACLSPRGLSMLWAVAFSQPLDPVGNRFLSTLVAA